MRLGKHCFGPHPVGECRCIKCQHARLQPERALIKFNSKESSHYVEWMVGIFIVLWGIFMIYLAVTGQDTIAPRPKKHPQHAVVTVL